jgi:hypothetical protein
MLKSYDYVPDGTPAILVHVCTPLSLHCPYSLDIAFLRPRYCLYVLYDFYMAFNFVNCLNAAPI